MERKVLLIQMPGWNVDYPPHGLAYVAALFAEAGWNCRVADLNIRWFRMASDEDKRFWNPCHWGLWYDRSFIEDLLGAYQPQFEDTLTEILAGAPYDIAAFTVNGLSKHLSLEASRVLRKLDPSLRIMFGGPICFPSKHNKRFFGESGAPDIICQGESEVALPLFLEEFEKTGEYRTTVPGFAYRVGNEVADTGEPLLPEFKNAVSRPDWSQFDLSLYRHPGHVPVFFSRGCPYRCAFCPDRNDYKRYRSRLAADVFSEIASSIEWAGKYACRPFFHFSDQLINANVSELEKLCDLMVTSDVGIEWRASARFRPEMSRRLLEKMSRSGCRELFWGLESASQNVIRRMGKDYDLQSARKILIDSFEVGIQNCLPTIVGFPGETAADLIETVFFVLQFRKYARFEDPNILQVIPNSSLHDNPEEWDLIVHAPHDWKTTDLKNDLDVRIWRRFLLRNVIQNRSLSLRSVVDWKNLMCLDLNSFSVACDVVSVLYGLWKVDGIEGTMVSVLENWQGGFGKASDLVRGGIAEWHPRSIPTEINLETWFCSDKNTDDARSRICTYLFEAIKRAWRQVNVVNDP